MHQIYSLQTLFDQTLIDITSQNLWTQCFSTDEASVVSGAGFILCEMSLFRQTFQHPTSTVFIPLGWFRNKHHMSCCRMPTNDLISRVATINNLWSTKPGRVCGTWDINLYRVCLLYGSRLQLLGCDTSTKRNTILRFLLLYQCCFFIQGSKRNHLGWGGGILF